jgi:hypothetical protein
MYPGNGYTMRWNPVSNVTSIAWWITTPGGQTRKGRSSMSGNIGEITSTLSNPAEAPQPGDLLFLEFTYTSGGPVGLVRAEFA